MAGRVGQWVVELVVLEEAGGCVALAVAAVAAAFVVALDFFDEGLIYWIACDGLTKAVWLV